MMGSGSIWRMSWRRRRDRLRTSLGILRDREVDVVINYLPVGSEQATKWYVEQVLAAGCAFVNCIPVFIAKEAYWQKRFEDKGCAGGGRRHQVAGGCDDHSSRLLARLFEDRGVRLDKTYQLNFGGNTDFYNMLERTRLGVRRRYRRRSRCSLSLEKESADERCSHQPERPRCVVGRPEVGLHPIGGYVLGRCPVERGVEAGG